MTRGDDLFNARDWTALDDVHHPDMIAFIPGGAEPIYGRKAHGTAMQQLVRRPPAEPRVMPVIGLSYAPSMHS